MVTADLFNSIGLIILSASAAQILSWRFKIPNILILMVFGLILGPLTQTVDPHEIFGSLVEIVIELTVVVLLFEGGLTLKFKELKGISSG